MPVLYHAGSPLLVVKEKLLHVVQEKLKKFNVGQAFGASIWPGIWGIHLTVNQIVTVAMILCLAKSPLLVVQEKLKTFNAGHVFETQPELHKIFTDSHFHLDKLLDELKVNALKEVQDKHQKDNSLDFAIADYVYPEKMAYNTS